MKVSDLILALRKLDPDAQVICFCPRDEDGAGHEQTLYDIDEITMGDGVTEQRAAGKATIRFGKGEGSRRLAIIGITPEF